MIICSNEEGKSNVISRLYSYRREWNLPTDEDIEHLKKFLLQNVAEVNKKSYIAHVDAKIVDINQWVISFNHHHNYCNIQLTSESFYIGAIRSWKIIIS